MFTVASNRTLADFSRAACMKRLLSTSQITTRAEETHLKLSSQRQQSQSCHGTGLMRKAMAAPTRCLTTPLQSQPLHHLEPDDLVNPQLPLPPERGSVLPLPLCVFGFCFCLVRLSISLGGQFTGSLLLCNGG